MPIFYFWLPIYSYWHFDDFSWGNTRRVDGKSVPEEDMVDDSTLDAIVYQQCVDLEPAPPGFEEVMMMTKKDQVVIIIPEDDEQKEIEQELEHTKLKLELEKKKKEMVEEMQKLKEETEKMIQERKNMQGAR